MNRPSDTQTYKQKSTATPAINGVFQRKCACGNHTIAGGECEECGKKKRFGLQTKLKVNEPGNVYEQEADRIADQVMAAPAHSAVSGTPPRIQRLSEQSNGKTGAAPESVDLALAGPGRTLEPALRQDMEQRFGHDFSQVRVHSGAVAEQSAGDLNANAFTVGHDMVFGADRFAPRTIDGQRLLAHELTHVVQHGFATQTIQRQPSNVPKSFTTNRQLIFDEIKKRNSDLANLITPASILGSISPPVIKGGPMKSGVQHLWMVSVVPGIGSPRTEKVKETQTKVKGVVQVMHNINITLVPVLVPDKKFLKQVSSPNVAYTLTIAEILYHELLHARIMMESDPNWTSQHTQVFQDYTNIMRIANSPAVDKEREALKQEIGKMAAGGNWTKDIAIAQEQFFEFLVHEKYDANTEGTAFGNSFPNAFIAKKNSEVVAQRLGLGDSVFDVIKKNLPAVAEKLFDKLDQEVANNIRNSPLHKLIPALDILVK